MRYRLILMLLLPFAVLVSACAASTTTTVDSTASTTVSTDATPAASTSTTTTDAGTSLAVTDCSDPSETFESLCDAYSLIRGHFVDDTDDATLLAGALEEIELSELDPGSGSPSEVVCSVPNDSFAPLCDALVERIDEDGADLDAAVEAAIAGMINVGLDDPYSNYLSPTQLANFRIETSGSVEGIGALVQGQDSTDPEGEPCSELSDTCHMVIVQPLEGSPAEAAGIQSGDFVVTVDGEGVEGKLLDEIVAIVRGPAGTDVTLGIERDGTILEFTVTRAAITVPNVESEILDSGVAYIRLVTFANNADEAIEETLREVLEAGATDIIFDLRSNPGGSLEAAVNIASEFLEDGLVLVTQAPGDEIEYPVKAGGLATDGDIGLAVLVDRASASASEVVAGVLQETGRATIVGETTFGKNTVQQQFNLDNGGAIKLTIARWLTPNGTDLGAGVTPDIMVEFDPSAEEDPWISAAEEALGY